MSHLLTSLYLLQDVIVSMKLGLGVTIPNESIALSVVEDGSLIEDTFEATFFRVRVDKIKN